jgi:hypothetical protein
MTKRVFISFDFDNDATLRTFLAGQAKLPDSPFEFGDASVKKHLTGDWEAKVRERIRRADLVAVICGKFTHTAVGVARELQIAREISKPYFLLAGYKAGTNTKPTTALTTDKIYDWTWPNLKSLIAGNR